MSYDTQTKLIIKTMEENPKFKKAVEKFRKRWTYKGFEQVQIIIKGRPISCKVIRELDL